MTFMSCPLRYVFKRSAEISAEDTPSLPDGMLLWGTVSHRILGEFMKKWERHAAPGEAEKELDRMYISYINKEINGLMLPGRDTDREELRLRITRSGRRMVQIMQENNFGRVEDKDIEAEYKQDTEIGVVGGRCDLVLRKKDNPNELFIMDIKSNWNRYFEIMRQGRAVQLAMYSRIAPGDWPPTGFLIVEKGEMLTHHGPEVIKGAFQVQSPRDEGETWERVKEEVELVRKSFASGKVYLGDDWKSDPHFQPAECVYCEYRKFCGIDLPRE
jgi:CRISPR/Cas system-associated exonuclease Cas4 (RecB family)